MIYTSWGLAKTSHAGDLVTGDDDLPTLKRFGRCLTITPRQFEPRMHRNTLNCS
ncbi:MAG: hypothetical protein ABSE63_15010 [Thermoguttaceae bacterium]